MTEKEFRKLRSLDLIQILLTQSNEETRLQEELDRQKEHLEGLRTHNEDLKTALNDKDALIESLKQNLNQSDTEIHGLREELKALYTDKRINLENIGSLTEVAKRVNQIFETAQREAEEYLAHPERVYAIEEDEYQESVSSEEDTQNVLENVASEEDTRNDLENIESKEVARNPESGVIDSMDTDDIKVEVAINGTETADDITSESVIFEASAPPAETEALEAGMTENTDEVPATDTADDIAEETAEASAESAEEVVTAKAEDKSVESATPDPADSDALVAESADSDVLTAEPVDSDVLTAESAVGETDTASAETVTAEADSESTETTDIETDENPDSAGVADNVSSQTTAAVNHTTEAASWTTATAAKKAEPQHVKASSKNSRQNRSLFRKFIGGIKREKGGR